MHPLAVDVGQLRRGSVMIDQQTADPNLRAVPPMKPCVSPSILWTNCMPILPVGDNGR
jgi:hypothetical protein